MKSLELIAAFTMILVATSGSCFAQDINYFGSETPTTSLGMTIRIFDYGDLSASSSEEMITEAGWIFLKAGIKTRWVDCRSKQQDEGKQRTCESSLGSTDVILRIMPGAIPQSARLPETALGFAVVKGDGGSMASVYLGRIEAIAQGCPATKGQILGHAAAHEIGHLLLGTLEHSPNGIMKGDWRGKILDSIAKRDMLFSSRQAEYMRKQVHERQRRSEGLQSAGLR